MTIRPYAVCVTAEDVRYTADYLGSQMFSPETMRFFKSRLLSAHRSLSENSGLIITSEPYAFDGPRVYQVRRYDITHSEGQDSIGFENVGTYDTRSSAHTALKNFKGE